MASLGCGLVSCDQFEDAADAKPVQYVDVVIDLGAGLSARADGDMVFDDEITVKMTNYGENLVYNEVFTGSRGVVKNVIPGLYTINVAGKATDSNGQDYKLAASYNNYPINSSAASAGNNSSTGGESTGNQSFVIPVEMQLGQLNAPLVFSEIYYCGSKPPVGFSYFRDQFYEIANNSNTVQYLDGLYFAHTEPIDYDKIMPIWPDGDDGKYVYAARIWQFPGNGTDYPLQPGESAVVSQFAANHKLELYNPNSPVDCSQSEFEFYMNSPIYTDQPAINMKHAYYDGGADMGSLPQYLTSVFGTAYIIFRVPEGDTWDPVFDTSLQTKNAADSWSSIYAKVPLEYVVDAVEGIRNDTYVVAKNIPALLDVGFVTANGSYLGVGVTRKRNYDAPASNGAILYQDTNDSAADFESNVIPMLHRHSSMPSWNPSLN